MHIDRTYKRLANEIREYTKGQARFWRQVPFWALEADGRNGWYDVFEEAYMRGLWWPNLLQPRGTLEFPAIDCATGDIVRGKEPWPLEKVVEPDKIVPLWGYRDMLNAGEVLKDLREKAGSNAMRGSDPAYPEREHRRQLYGVRLVFERFSEG